MTATAHAPGKVILLGEHAVVYGRPALVAAIDRGARATAGLAARGFPSQLTVLGRSFDADPGGHEDLARAFAALLAPAGGGAAATRNVVVDASSELPPGGGLGSSAALGVAIARAVCAVVDGDAIEPSVIARADAWERVFHGNPSGIDTAASVRGGCLRFVRGAGATDATLARELRLCVGWSGRSSSTRVMVERVAALRERDADRVDRDLDAIAALVEGAVVALSAGDLAALGERMDRNQSLLGGLGVSTPAIEAMCDAARGAGALGAKLTGAGGGGSVIALLRSSDDGGDDPAAGEAVLDAWRAAGFDGFVTRVRRGAAEVR